ncbi:MULTISPECIES: RNA polymerase sigma factor [Cupriavidus]|uniref:RNA polymerase sigma factor n=1 Tax=Cupriavidus basilensis TaxID=68895 RepID=A0A643G2I5_9BURK|nr:MULTISPECIES: RNA polymerase sigma factor [Cupriavidus]MBB1635396.1 RNA polymerase subunit sigma-70 [Cupriavidus sp. UME77]MCP3019409.1 RNA polymerase sigma factor [Cupriavidus basilensis]MDR3385235.1 RNA polymerase sigma factor [Cupriavidus basilensis]QOT75464.1 RNA polymerase sigma factor [Cupriavidus basilensis]
MSDSSRSSLRELLAQRYDDLKRRLTWRLGSAELASDALHDTWVHLEDRKEEGEPVKSPAAYLMRMATNLALDRLQRDRRYMSAEEMETLMAEIVDPAPGPAQTVAARDEVEAVARLIESMPPRRRAIFLAVRVDELSNQEAAVRFGVSPRLIGLELKRAHEYCMAHSPKHG